MALEQKLAALEGAEASVVLGSGMAAVTGAIETFGPALADQVFVKAADGKQTVGAHLKAAGTTVKGFTLYVVGEGIEKKVDDFAAEVAAQVAAAKAQ